MSYCQFWPTLTAPTELLKDSNSGTLLPPTLVIPLVNAVCSGPSQDTGWVFCSLTIDPF